MPNVESWQGRFFEDYMVGDIFESRAGRTITDADNIWFTLLTNNTNQAHFNEVYAKRAGMNKCIVNSALTLAIVAGLTVTDVSENGINLGWDNIKLIHPVFPGDTVFARTTVTEVRESSSKPHMGIVTVTTEGVNQDGVIFMRYTRSILTYKRDHAPSQGAFPQISE